MHKLHILHISRRNDRRGCGSNPLNRHFCMADGSANAAECSGSEGEARRCTNGIVVAADVREVAAKVLPFDVFKRRLVECGWMGRSDLVIIGFIH